MAAPTAFAMLSSQSYLTAERVRYLKELARQDGDSLVYLLHLTKAMSHAQHYLGFATGGWPGVCRRLEIHRNTHWTPPPPNPDGSRGIGGNVTYTGRNRGSKFVAAAQYYGAGLVIARLFPGGEHVEKYLKALKKATYLCPICCQQAGRKVMLAGFDVPIPMEEA